MSIWVTLGWGAVLLMCAMKPWETELQSVHCRNYVCANQAGPSQMEWKTRQKTRKM